MIFRMYRILYAMSVHYKHRSGQSKKEFLYPVPFIFDIIICGFALSCRCLQPIGFFLFFRSLNMFLIWYIFISPPLQWASFFFIVYSIYSLHMWELLA